MYNKTYNPSLTSVQSSDSTNQKKKFFRRNNNLGDKQRTSRSKSKGESMDSKQFTTYCNSYLKNRNSNCNGLKQSAIELKNNIKTHASIIPMKEKMEFKDQLPERTSLITKQPSNRERQGSITGHSHGRINREQILKNKAQKSLQEGQMRHRKQKNFLQSEIKCQQKYISELKGKIKEGEYLIQSLKSQVDWLRSQNKNLHQQLAQLKDEQKVSLKYKNSSQQMRQKYLFEEIKQLKGRITKSKLEQEQFLQNELDKKEKTILSLKSEANCLRIKIHNLEYQNNQKISQLSLKYQDQIKDIKANFHVQLRQAQDCHSRHKNSIHKSHIITNRYHGKLSHNSNDILELSP